MFLFSFYFYYFFTTFTSTDSLTELDIFKDLKVFVGLLLNLIHRHTIGIDLYNVIDLSVCSIQN